MKKWDTTKHATIFHLSTKLTQFNFKDSAQMILSSDAKHLTYIDKRGEAKIYLMAKADTLRLDQKNPKLTPHESEMVKRLTYTKQILNAILAKQPQYKNKNLLRDLDYQAQSENPQTEANSVINSNRTAADEMAEEEDYETLDV